MTDPPDLELSQRTVDTHPGIPKWEIELRYHAKGSRKVRSPRSAFAFTMPSHSAKVSIRLVPTFVLRGPFHALTPLRKPLTKRDFDSQVLRRD